MLIIRKALAGDSKAVAKILTQAVGYKLQRSDNAWGEGAYTEEEVLGPIQKGLTYASQGDKPVGTFQLHWEDALIWGEQPPTAGYIHQLAIAQAYHGQDLGAQIIEWVSKEVAAQKRQLLRLDCPAVNKKLCQYYERLGFKLVGQRKFHKPKDTEYVSCLYERRTP
jgi:GNAT superfamily N-acetyltransferase